MMTAITFANTSTFSCLLFALSPTVEASRRRAAAFVEDNRTRLISRRLSTKIKSAPFEALENEICADPMNGLFIEWLNQKGCCTDAVRIDFNDLGLRGLCANRAICKGEIIASIPYAAALPVGNTMLDGYHGELLMEEFKNDGVLDEVDLSNYHADDIYDAFQGLKFLTESVQNPKWKPYVDSLPKLPTIGDEAGLTPDFWSREVIMEIQIPSFVTRTLQRKHLVEKIATAAKISDRELRWATWMIRSRRFSTIDSVYEESPSSEKRFSLLEWLSSRIIKKDVVKGYLLPLLDMSNHSSHPNASIAIKIDKFARKFDETSSFVLRAIRNVDKNEELTISYLDGDGTSLDFLDKYGFFTEDNPNDEILLAKRPSIPTTLDDDEEKQREIDTSVVENGSISTVLSLRISLKKRAGSRV